jgi:hypothetical protein
MILFCIEKEKKLDDRLIAYIVLHTFVLLAKNICVMDTRTFSLFISVSTALIQEDLIWCGCIFFSSYSSIKDCEYCNLSEIKIGGDKYLNE